MIKKIIFTGVVYICMVQPAYALTSLAQFVARTPIHYFGAVSSAPEGFSPADIKKVYHLPETGGKGTIAIIAAYDDPTIEKDLAVFSKEFGLAPCTNANGCLEKHKMDKSTKADAGWSGETSLDVEWSHAIAPEAKILLIEAKSASGPNLIKAIEYARKRKDVVAVSMSWGGDEFKDEVSLDTSFVGVTGATFFASSGDNGYGTSWPAASSNVVAVGGTTLVLDAQGNFASERAWNGSGGGISLYEPIPVYQKDYGIKKAKNMRAIPDVSYNADPQSGVSVYYKGWHVVGGTSAGAPQWAAIRSLGLSASNDRFYHDKASSKNSSYFRDITSGTNGDCGYYCSARKHYDYVTGLGSPLTSTF